MVRTRARRTRTGTMAMLSPRATAASPYLAELIKEFAPGKRVINVGCEGLEDLIDAGGAGALGARAGGEPEVRPSGGESCDGLGGGTASARFVLPSGTTTPMVSPIPMRQS